MRYCFLFATDLLFVGVFQVSDRQNYLLLSLVLCVCLGILLCVNHVRIAVRPTADPEPPSTKSPTYCSPERYNVDYEPSTRFSFEGINK